MEPRAPGSVDPRPVEHDRKHASEKKIDIGGQGGTCPLGLPSPVGERGGHPRNCTECVMGRISPEPKNYFGKIFSGKMQQQVQKKKIKKIGSGENL